MSCEDGRPDLHPRCTSSNGWREATENSGPPFSVVVLGAGMYGAYCAAKLYREHPEKRVPVLDAGHYLVEQHVQNLGQVGLDVASPILPSDDTGRPHDLVWGLPWRGNVAFPGLAYCVGGKSLFWGGWCPRLTTDDLSAWPATTAQYLQDHYAEIEREIGVDPATDFISGDLCAHLRERLVAAAAVTPDIETTLGDHGVEVAPLAVQGNAPASGLFGLDKFSSVPTLVDAIRDDITASDVTDARRRLFLVPRAHAISASLSQVTISSIDLDVSGERQTIAISPDCAVILAMSAIESTRFALHSFPTPLMGRNLTAHPRSDFTVRIHRSALPAADQPAVETAALLVRGYAPSGRFHLQVTASTSRRRLRRDALPHDSRRRPRRRTSRKPGSRLDHRHRAGCRRDAR